MNRLSLLSISAASAFLVTAPASADIVKAPIGPSSEVRLNASTKKALKNHGVSLRATGSARKSGATLELPYSLARWDFASHEGDIAHFKKNTGFRLRLSSGRSIAMVHPRVVVDGTYGYITALISNVRVKTFTFRLPSGTIKTTSGMQTISGLRLKLTKASADMLNKGLRRNVLRRYSQFGTLELNIRRPSGSAATVGLASAPGQGTNPGATLRAGPSLLDAVPIGGLLTPIAPGVGIDTNGDGQPDTGVFGLSLNNATFDATTETGTISLNGGLAVRVAGQDVMVLDDPEVVVGTTAQSSGLYATVNGVRVKVGDIDPASLNVDVANGTVTVSDLTVTATSTVLPVLGLLPPGTQLLTLDVSLPQV